jgi:hypothetical protein
MFNFYQKCRGVAKEIAKCVVLQRLGIDLDTTQNL